ncbi:hypothetical protein [Pyxidicoccus trucidator]|uniref:hypothetical protein n=1 Tax=Pyxidicoccus trucidator TaxID=2709662 RepID=UPI0013DC92ED|nr:hypothetical protein [Pyxidicoccus trucidator]
MYRCQSCQKSVGPRVSSHRVTVATRLTEFPARPGTQRHAEGRRVRWKDDPGGMGLQIARELQVCGPCATARQRSGPVPAA